MASAMHRAVILSLLATALPAMAAGEETDQIAARVPVEISEIVTGGSWTSGAETGVYRAMVVARPSPEGQRAEVVVQMIVQETAGAAKVARTILIKEVGETNLASAYLAMDTEAEDEMTLIITAYGAATDQDTTINVKFDGAGSYQIMPAAAEEAPPAEGGATQK